MASLKPLVLEGIELVPFVQYILHRHAPSSTLIVCSSKETFLKQLHLATSDQIDQDMAEAEKEDLSNIDARQKKPTNPWSVPTLRLLASSRTVKLAFCPDVPHLRAYLATYAHQLSDREGLDDQARTSPDATPLLAILNPIQLHRPTSAFSAQGLNRTFSIAVEAAHQSQSRLVLAECSNKSDGMTPSDTWMGAEVQGEAMLPRESVWDEEVSILNVTTKTFGAGERGWWVGRTVKIRAIAGRWCSFELSTARED